MDTFRIADSKIVLAFCNKIRAALGGDKINNLVPGKLSNSRECVLANSLNFDCKVRPVTLDEPLSGSPWAVGFKDKYIFETLKLKLKLEPTDIEIQGSSFSKIVEKNAEDDRSRHWLLLPSEIALLAKEFDEGRWMEYVSDLAPFKSG